MQQLLEVLLSLWFSISNLDEQITEVCFIMCWTVGVITTLKFGNQHLWHVRLWNAPYVDNKALAQHFTLAHSSICFLYKLNTNVFFSNRLMLICSKLHIPKPESVLWEFQVSQRRGGGCLFTSAQAELGHLLPALYSEGLSFDTGRWHVSSKAGSSHLLSVHELQVIYAPFPPSE